MVVVQQVEFGLFFVVPEQLGARIFLEVLNYVEAEGLAVGQTLHLLLMQLRIVSELILLWQTLVLLLLLLSMILI